MLQLQLERGLKTGCYRVHARIQLITNGCTRTSTVRKAVMETGKDSNSASSYPNRSISACFASPLRKSSFYFPFHYVPIGET
jgi:hypothetical protein